MPLCFPYRYFMAIMTGCGLVTIQCLRAGFVLVVTYTLKSKTSNFNDLTIYPDCTVLNTTRDYQTEFSQEVSMQFHTVYFMALSAGTLTGGHVSHRFSANRSLGVAILTVSLLSLILPSVYQRSAAGVFIIRAVQGLSEGIAQTQMSVIICAWALKHDKSRLLSITFLGFSLSPALAMIMVGASLCYVRWDSSLYLLGATGVMWAVAWVLFSYPNPQECPYLSKTESVLHATESDNIQKGSSSLAAKVPWKKILTSKPVWAIWIGCLCKNFISSTVVALQPQFFKDIFGIRTADIGLLLSLPFFITAIGMVIWSYLADRLIASKRLSITNVRKLMQCIGALTESMFFVCMIYADSWQLSFTFLALAYTMGGMTFPGYNCNILDLSPQFSGAVSAVVFTATIGGAFSTFIASLVPGKNSTRSNWAVIFWIEAALAGSSALLFFLFATGERQAWGDAEFEVLPSQNDVDSQEAHRLENGYSTLSSRKSYTGNETFGKTDVDDNRGSVCTSR